MTNTNTYGPKHFKTIKDTFCFMDNGFIKTNRHILGKGLDYTTTNAQYLDNGDLYFDLYDEDGWIGNYVIYKQFLSGIKIITK
jgi:hypothetical protein